MNPSLIEKWLNWLDECQGHLTQENALKMMREQGGLTRKQCNALFNQWLRER